MSESSVNIKISASFDKEQILKEFKELTAELEASQLSLKAAIGANDTSKAATEDQGTSDNSGSTSNGPTGFTNLIASLENIASNIKSAISAAVSPINTVKESFNPKGLGQEATKLLGDVLQEIKGLFKDEISSIVDFIKGSIEGVAKSFLSLFQSEMDAANQSVANATENIENSISEQIALIIEAVKEWMVKSQSQGKRTKQSSGDRGDNSDSTGQGGGQTTQTGVVSRLDILNALLDEQLNKMTGDILPDILSELQFDFVRTALEGVATKIGSSVAKPIINSVSNLTKLGKNTGQAAGKGQKLLAGTNVQSVDLQNESQSTLPEQPKALTIFRNEADESRKKTLIDAINILKSIKNLLIEIRNYLLGGNLRQKTVSAAKSFNSIAQATSNVRQLAAGTSWEVDLKPVTANLDELLIELPRLNNTLEKTRLAFSDSTPTLDDAITVEWVDASEPSRLLNSGQLALPSAEDNAKLNQSLGDLVTLNREQIQSQRGNLGLINSQSVLDQGKGQSGQATKDAVQQLKASLGNLGKAIASDLGKAFQQFNAKGVGSKAQSASTLINNLINIFNQFIAFLRKFNPGLATTIDNFTRKLIQSLNNFVSGLIPKLLPLFTSLKQGIGGLFPGGKPGQGLNINSVLSALQSGLPAASGSVSGVLGGASKMFYKIIQDLKTKLHPPTSTSPSSAQQPPNSSPDNTGSSSDPGTMLRASLGLLSGGMPTSLPQLPSVDIDKLLPVIKALTVNLAKNNFAPKQTAKGVVGDMFKLGFDKLIGQKLAAINPLNKLFPKAQPASLPAQFLKTLKQTGSVGTAIKDVGIDVLENKFDDLIAIARSPDDLQTKIVKAIESIGGVDGGTPPKEVNVFKAFMGNLLKTGSLGKASQFTAIDVFDDKFKKMVGAFQEPGGDRSKESAPILDLLTSALSNAISTGFNPGETLKATVVDLIGGQLSQNVGQMTGNQPQRITGKGITGGQVSRNIGSNAIKSGLNPIETAKRTGIDLTVKAFQLYLAKLARQAIDDYRNIPVNPVTAPDYLTASIENLANQPSSNLTDWDEANKWNVATDGQDILAFENLNDAFEKLADLILKISQVDVSALKQSNKYPTVNLDEFNDYKGSSAYITSKNKVVLPQATGENLKTNNLNKEQFLQLAHELRHAMQMGFGEGKQPGFN